MLSALVIAPVVLAVVYVGGPSAVAAATLVTLLALREFYALTMQGGWQPNRWVGYGLALVLLAAAGSDRLLGTPLPAGWHGPIVRLAIAASVIIPLGLAVVQRPQRGVLVGWALTVGGSLYIAWLMGHFVGLRLVGPAEEGRGWVFYVLAATWAYDSGAYLVGSVLGRHRFLTGISPNKTWEGAAGGTVAVLLVTLGAALPLPIWGWRALPLWSWQALPLALLLAAAAQLGDLAESLIKRQTGAKDAGELIPGHGGMLDRVDSLLFTVVVVYYYVVLVLQLAS